MDDTEGLFNTILKRYLTAVYNFAFRIMGDQSDAEDVTQEIFVKIWKNTSKIDPKQNLKAWIFAIARNTAIDWLRKKREIVFSKFDTEGDESYADTLPDLAPLPDELFEKQELKMALEEAFSKIRPDFKEIIILHNTEQLTFEEIAKIVGKPLNTVKSQYRRALHQMRGLIRV